jgi:hypothetical protein
MAATMASDLLKQGFCDFRGFRGGDNEVAPKDRAPRGHTRPTNRPLRTHHMIAIGET